MELWFSLWLGFRYLFIGLVIVYFLSGLDDLIVDAAYYGRALFRALFRRKYIKPVSLDQICAGPEKPAVIIVPAWDESNVIGRMLLNTLNTVRYRNYTIFVGTYPNDEATKIEVERVRELYPNVEVVVTPAAGPTNKADCLNWIFQGIKVFEQDHGAQFEIFVFHDAEDVIHPLSLKYYNYLMPRVSFIQIPVFPLEQKWWNFVVGMYMDEFAENHTKDLRAREALASAIPSAGVGTALTRGAMDYLAGLRKNQLFDITSLTEDYMMGLSLQDMPGRKILLQQTVERTLQVKRWWSRRPVEKKVRDWIATREFFPNTFKAAVHQKSRWILGISLQGWAFGWGRKLGLNYFLFRDRKAVVANLMTMAGYLVAAYWLLALGIGRLWPRLAAPPLVTNDEWVYTLVLAVLAMFGWRIGNRAIASWRIYGARQALLSVPRLIFGNYLNFLATVKAIRRYIQARISGQVPAWGKTSHAYPTADQLRTFHRKLGDILLDHRIVTLTQLQEALEIQKATGKKLGEILLELGAVWEEDVVFALAQQQNARSVELDPALTPPALLARVPRDLAVTFRVFPVEARGDMLILATDRETGPDAMIPIAKALGTSIQLIRTSTPDMEFALQRAYAGLGRPAPGGGDRLGGQLVKAGLITPAELVKALRTQKRTGERLGDILVSLGLVSREEIERILKTA
jgi:adsorption protein B